MNSNGVGIKDIAKSLNVSITTVSKVINGHADIGEKTRRAVVDKIAEMGYVPNFMATNLRRSKADMVALVLSDISKPYFGRVIEGYENALRSAGYHSMIFSSIEMGQREELFIRQIASMNMAGIIIDPAQDSDPEKSALKQTGIPYVFSNRFLDAEKDYYVAADNEKAGYIGTKHLLERKPERPVICVNGPSRISPTVLRFKGYKRALSQTGAIYDPGLVFDNCFGLSDAYDAGIESIRRVHTPFSVFCSTDQLAMGFIRAMKDSGLSVPKDVAVASVDDIDTSSYIIPALTTVSIPKELIGRESANMLVSLIKGREVESRRVLLDPELIIRESS